MLYVYFISKISQESSLTFYYALLLILGSPKMYGHMVKTRKNQFEIYKNGGKAATEKGKKK